MSAVKKRLPSPKAGLRNLILAICRISTVHQDDRSLDDQLALYREWLDREYPDGYKLEVMSAQVSGEDISNPHYLEVKRKIESGVYDVVITEDLSRIARRATTYTLCEASEDTKTRIIAINDGVDTFADEWRPNAWIATFKNEASNKDTSRRIRRSLRGRFQSGQLPVRLIAGYIADKPGALENEVRKDPQAERVYDEWFMRLECGESYAEIAVWLNSIKFKTGHAARRSDWNGTLVGQATNNTLLKGLRQCNRRMSKRVNQTGKRKSIEAPAEELLEREVPHLAFIKPERYDRVIRMIRKRNEKFRRGRAEARDPRQGRSRSDTRWPGQHVRCGICGNKFVLGGHGQSSRMMCDAVRRHNCWNAMSVSQPDLARSVAAEVFGRIETLPEFDRKVTASIEREAQNRVERANHRLTTLMKQKSKLLTEVKNLAKAIAGGQTSDTVMRLIQATERRISDIDDEIADARASTPSAVEIPSADDFRRLAHELFLELPIDSREFANVMRRIVKEFYVLPYRMIDKSKVQPRCIFQLDLAPLYGSGLPEGLDGLEIQCEVDLIDEPQRAKYRAEVVSLREAGVKEREIAARLGITQTAVQRAASLHRMTTHLGIDDPWQPVRSSEEVADCFARINNPRYKFKPIDGFEPKFPEK